MRMGIGLGVGINRSNYAQGIFNAYNLRVIADGGITEAGQCVNAVSSLLQSASLLLIPSGYKGGKAYAQIPTNGNGDLTWTRASDAWRTNADGLIQRVPWNLLQRSEEFANAWWSKTASVTSNTTISPNGNQDADTFTDSSNSYEDVRSTSISITANATYTASVFIKKTTGALTYYPGIGILLSSVSNRLDFGILNTTTGQVVRDASSTINVATYSTQSVGDYWRLIVTFTDNQSNLNCGVYFYPAISSNGTSISPLAQGSNVFWGAQLVEGSSAQTYFPTTDRLNVPRLSYMYGSCPALLLEPQRTNLALYSEDFGNAWWIKSNTTISTNTTTSPDGNTTADTLVENGLNSLHYTGNSSALTLTAQSYTLSVYAKKINRDWLALSMYDGTASRYVWFNLNTGAIGTIQSGATATITSVGNGWYRCTMTVQMSTGSNYVGIGSSTSDNVSTYIGTNGLSALFLWGAQLEAGAYPTTYIPTTTASATRIADTATKTGVSSLIGQSEGTVFLDIYFSQLSNAGFRAFFSLEGSTTNQFSGINPQTTNNGNDISYAGTNYTLTTGRHKIICTYSQTNNQRKLFVDGVLRATSTHTNFSATIDRYSVGCRINPFSAFDLDRQLSSDSGVFDYALFNSLLTDTQCQTLTTL